MNRIHLNLALGAVVAGLGLAVLLSQEKSEPAEPLTPLTADGVQRITLMHPDQPAIRLDKSAGHWALTEPVQVPAEALEVNALLALATLPVKSTLDAAAVAPAELGLEPPEFSIALNEEVLEFGGVEPLQYRRYVRNAGRIVLTDDPPGAALDADYSDLVSKSLLPEGAQIMQVRIGKQALSRSADGQGWTLEPAVADASPEQMQRWAAAWQDARALWNAQHEGELPKGERVTVTLQDRALEFIVAERDPQLVLVRPDLKIRYTLSKALETELLQLPPPPAPSPAPEAETAG